MWDQSAENIPRYDPGSVASLADALLARHTIFPPQQDEPKERLRGRLIEVELLENIRPERKVAT